MTQIGFNLDVPIKIYVDNVSAINLAKNPIFHHRSKHIDIRYHFLRDQVGKNMIKLEYCRSEDQIVDIFTKPLKIGAFINLRDWLGMKVCSKSELREDVDINSDFIIINCDFITLKLFYHYYCINGQFRGLLVFLFYSFQ